MDKSAFFKDIKKSFDINLIKDTLDEEKIEKFILLTDYMLAENTKYNLTAIKDVEKIIPLHYTDSVMLSRYLTDGASLIDVGCGAGFPTLPLAILRPDLKITALDATAKKVAYVSSAAKICGIDNVTAICGRAEEIAKTELREGFDFASARAVAELRVLSELCIPFVKKDGYFIAMKGKNGMEEYQNAKNAIFRMGGVTEEKIPYEIKTDGENFAERYIFKIRKATPTGKEYPRSFAQISKKPL